MDGFKVTASIVVPVNTIDEAEEFARKSFNWNNMIQIGLVDLDIEKVKESEK